MKKSGKVKKSVKISACMMVKNEEEMLPRCLNSIKHLVDEIIVVDTGSTDNTVEIARSFGAKIYHHLWENDFSKHRNQSIGYATGDWFLIIDADEELDAYELKKKDLKNSLSKAPKGLHCFLIKVLDKDKEENIASASESARIFKNNVGVEYRGIVHNTARYSGSVAPLDLRLFHYGYALSEEQMQDKYKRTSGLLLTRVEKDPLDHAAYFYLFQVYMEMKESQRAVGYANQCLEILSQGGESEVNPSFYYSLYHGVANAYIKTQLYEKAETMARRGLDIIPDEVDLFYDLAAIGYFTNNPDLMIEGGQNYLRVVDDFRTNASRAGTRFVFTASKDGELHVSFWLMLAYIRHDRFTDFSDIWEINKESITANPFYQKKLFAILEEKEALDTLANIGSYLLSRIEAIPVEDRREVLSRLMYVLRDKITRQDNNDIKDERHLETVVTQYLDLVESYDAIPVDDAIILSEFLLGKNMGEFFLDLTLSLFDRTLAGKIKVLDTNEVVATGYALIAGQQKKNRKGLLLSLSCLNIAWGLTKSEQFLEASEKIKGLMKRLSKDVGDSNF